MISKPVQERQNADEEVQPQFVPFRTALQSVQNNANEQAQLHHRIARIPDGRTVLRGVVIDLIFGDLRAAAASGAIIKWKRDGIALEKVNRHQKKLYAKPVSIAIGKSKIFWVGNTKEAY